jgi:antitoxin FitA
VYTYVVVSTIQIRDVPEEVHAALRSKAATAGLSLSEYMLREAIRVAERPAIADVLRRNERREWGVAPGEAVAVLRRMRDGESAR